MSVRIRRALRFVNTRLREYRMIAKGLLSSDHPVLAHLIPIRRCNLSCTYCNEFDDFSKPVPTEVMLERVTNISMGTEIDAINEFEELALNPNDAPTAIGLLD